MEVHYLQIRLTLADMLLYSVETHCLPQNVGGISPEAGEHMDFFEVFVITHKLGIHPSSPKLKTVEVGLDALYYRNTRNVGL